VLRNVASKAAEAEEPVSALINGFAPPAAKASGWAAAGGDAFVHLEWKIWDLRDG
jgi:hypothetical protein